MKTHVGFRFVWILFLVSGCISANTSSEKPTTTLSRTPVRSTPSSPVFTATNSLTPTFTETLTPSPDGYDVIMEMPSGYSGTSPFTVGPDGDFWSSPYDGPRRLVRFRNGVIIQEIEIDPELVYRYIDLEVRESDMWLFGFDHKTQRGNPKIVHLGLDGKVLDSWAIPERLFTNPDGSFADLGIRNILFGQDGELELEGTTGMYRFFDDQGDVNPQRLDGYIYDGMVYKLENVGIESKPCILVMGEKSIVLPYTPNCLGVDIIAYFPDGSIYIQIPFGIDKDVNRILHYSSNGELQEMAIGPLYYSWPFVTVSRGGDVYLLISLPDLPTQIIRLCFSSELLPKPASTPTP